MKTKGSKGERRRIIVFLLFWVMFAAVLLPVYAQAVTLPTGKVGSGQAQSGMFKENKGIYSDWRNLDTSFAVSQEYGFRLNKTRDTTFTKLGTEDRAGGTAVQQQQFPSGDLTNFWVFNIEDNDRVGYEADNFTIYNTATRSLDKVDVRITVSDWKKHPGDTADKSFVAINHTSARPAVILMNLESAKMKIEYYKSGTAVPYKVKSHFTVEDIDCHQFAAYSMSKNNISHQYASSDSELHYGVSDGLQVFYGPTDEDKEERIPEYAVGATYETSAFELTLGQDDRDTKRTYSRFGFAAYDMVRKEVPPPYKTVSDLDQKEVETNTLSHANEAFSYKITQKVPSGIAPAGYYRSFVMEDQVDDCIKILKVKIEDLDGMDRKNWFDVKISGQKVTAEATPSALKSSEFFGGASANDTGYCMIIEAALDQSKTAAELEKCGHYNSDKTQLTFKNKGKAEVDGKSAQTNETVTRVGVPDLEITKTVSPYEWQVTDPVSYTVKVKHTAKSSAPATSLLIKDTDLPKGLDLKEESLKADGIHGEYTLKKVEGGFKLEAEKMEENESVTITFDAEAKAAVNGKIVPNTATADAYSMTEQKKDSQSVYINSPKLKLEKTTTKENYKAGDTIPFQIQLTQINEGTFMRDVQIGEELKTPGLSLRKGSIQVMNSRDKVITSKCDIQVKDNGFFIETGLPMASKSGTIPPSHEPYSGLPLETRLTVTYEAEVVSETLAGKDIESVTTAPTRPNTNGDLIYENEETPSGGDVAAKKVNIRQAVLDMEKEADKTFYQPGETGKYKLTVTQTVQDAVVENVVIRDDFRELIGMRVQKDSLHVEKEGQDITGSCDISIDEKGDGFTVRTGQNLAANEKITLSYDVLYYDAALAGRDLINTASASGDNAKEDRDDAKVTIKEPRLHFVKTSDKEIYHLGDTAEYQILVKQERDHVTAENVTIEDMFQQEGMEIIPDSFLVTLEGKDITKECTITMKDGNRGFTVSTGKNLKESEEIKVTYKVLMRDETLADKDLKNIAVVSTENLPDQETEHTVKVDDKGELWIGKGSDKPVYRPGDTAVYKLKIAGVSQIPVRNVVIKDRMKTEGVKIKKDSIKVIDSNENVITANCKIEASNSEFEIVTPAVLERGQIMQVIYEVVLPQTSQDEPNTSESSNSAEAGKPQDAQNSPAPEKETREKAENTAFAEGDNADEKKAEHEAEIIPPGNKPGCDKPNGGEPSVDKPGGDKPGGDGPNCSQNPGEKPDPDPGKGPGNHSKPEQTPDFNDDLQPEGEPGSSGDSPGAKKPDAVEKQTKAEQIKEMERQLSGNGHAVQTGDEFNTAPLFITMGIAALVILILLHRRNRRRDR